MTRFENGHTRLPGAGRKKGVPNRATRNAREAIALLIDSNIDRLQGWLDEIAAKQGALASMRCFIDLLEYNLPRLSRAELTVERPEKKGKIIDSRLLSHTEREALRAIMTRAMERERIEKEGRLIEADKDKGVS
jgi:hypothetical protein